MIRILVTGSRTWWDVDRLAEALDAAVGAHMHLLQQPVIVHGQCDPRTLDGKRVPWDIALARPGLGPFLGADWHADRHAEARGWRREPHPADWDRYRKAAGHVRNRQMVTLGAVLCVGFPLGESPGTRGCLALADDAGIPTIIYEGTAHA